MLDSLRNSLFSITPIPWTTDKQIAHNGHVEYYIEAPGSSNPEEDLIEPVAVLLSRPQAHAKAICEMRNNIDKIIDTLETIKAIAENYTQQLPTNGFDAGRHFMAEIILQEINKL